MSDNPNQNTDTTQNEEQNQKGASRVDLQGAARAITKGNKTGGIIIAILMIILGILFMLRPLITEAIAMYLAMIGLVIYGIFQIIVYAKTPSELKNGWKLANGIIFIILGVLLIAGSPVVMIEMFAFLLGFLAMFSGINQIAASSAVKKAGESGSGWLLASGIINLVLSAFFIIAPFAASFILAYILGLYLIIGGVALFAEACSGQLGKKM
ncbi:MAG: HdeD family acid-resistance protein [Christensenellaceae bacterium]|jgi:uncharacterized membrane protein HdeD (DUF308 family)